MAVEYGLQKCADLVCSWSEQHSRPRPTRARKFSLDALSLVSELVLRSVLTVWLFTITQAILTLCQTSTVPMYQSELCEAEKRGRLVSSEPLFVGVGIEIAYWFDYGMSFVPGSIAWRLPIACQMIFAFV